MEQKDKVSKRTWPSLSRLVSAVCVLCALVHCDSQPDPRELRGFVNYALRAIEQDDPDALFRVIDSRSRAAMFSIVSDRQAARALIEAHYPEAERDEALRSITAIEADRAETPEEYFAALCDHRCREAFRDNLGAPTEERQIEGPGETLEVSTTRGTIVVHRQDSGHWWGLVWELNALDDARNRASRDLRQIETNVTTFERRERLGSP